MDKPFAMTVSQLNDYVKALIDSSEVLSNVRIVGEISNFTNHRSGHLYFSLKDSDGQIRAVMFRSRAMGLKFMPESGMKVIVHTRTPKNDGTEFVSFEELLGRSDVISLHCPLTDESRLMMNEAAFNKCKKGALLVNTARGGLVDEPALKAAVESGRLSGAALDAITVEPMRHCILKGVDNIVITPHAAWAPMSTRIKLLGITVDCIKGWLDGTPINVVSKL